MSWRGHRVYTGALGAGKTRLAIEDSLRRPGPVFFWDPNHDAPLYGFDWLADHSDSVEDVLGALKAGQRVLFRSSGVAQAWDEVTFACWAAARTGASLVIDEAHLVARQGRVLPDLLDLWQRGRHLSVEISLATPVPQTVDYQLMATASEVIVFRQRWAPWLVRLGLDAERVRRLRRHQHYRIDSSGVHGPLGDK